MRELGHFVNRNGYWVSAPLLPGHGTHPDDLNRVHFQDWIDEAEKAFLALQAQCRRVFIIGLSAGGAIALNLLSRYPAEGCILLSTVIRLKWYQTLLVPGVKYILRARPKRNRMLIHGNLNSDMGYNCYPLGGTAELIKMLRETRAKLPSVQCPVMIMHSSCDRQVPAWNAEIIHREIGAADKCTILLDAPCHLITRGDDKAVIQREVIRFLDERIKNRPDEYAA